MCRDMVSVVFFFFFKQKTAYEMRISDWSSDVCSSDLYCMRAAPHCDDLDALLDVARTFAEDALMVPLSEAEVVKTARSAWDYEVTDRNLFGRGAALIPIGRASCRAGVCQYV